MAEPIEGSGSEVRCKRDPAHGRVQIRNRVAAVVFLGSVLVGISGCAQTPIPQANALVGTWHHKSDGSAIILRANGTASLEDVPKNALLNLPDKPGGQAENLEGTWAMGGPLNEKRDNGDPVLTIDVHASAKSAGVPIYSITPTISGTGSKITFSWIIGDPDANDNYVFTR
jgi:hypothetical protein